MNTRILLLVCMVCMTIVPALAVSSDDYLGGSIQLGGAGTQITIVPTTAGTTAAETVAPMVAAAAGALQVTTTPAGASIFVDGAERGISPATISDLPPGSHTLLLKLGGYQDLSAPVTITTGQTQTYMGTLLPATTAQPALPTATRSPGFGMILGIAALGAVLLVTKALR